MPRTRWDIEDYRIKLAPGANSLSASPSTVHLDSSSLSETVIRTAYKQAAYIVDKYGDRYLPIFERLHQEVIELESKESLKSVISELCEEIDHDSHFEIG